ncbi:DUF262 domain-containing protein [Kitasatospora sp. NPDC127121]|uniref:DUF262 domain-containing protein n=1 Tax=Kitasatospora sp. NPDC127121 TaxID=3345371 RepID=UPI003628A7A5
MSTDGLETQPSATTFDLAPLVEDAWRGRVRVPHFQRGFRWTQKDVIRLFESIVRGYPIGSLLLWVRKSPAATVTLGAVTVKTPSLEEGLWVVDGQQRITSLANALHPEGSRRAEFAVAYDLVSGDFLPIPAQPAPHIIPVHVLFDLDALLVWFSEADSDAKEYFPEARRVARKLQQFKVPAYLVRQDDEKILKDIFDRMNNFGKKLSRAEVFSALNSGSEEGHGERLSIRRISERIAAETGFGEIDDDTVLRAILARRGPDPAREIRGEFDYSKARRFVAEFPGEDAETAYEEGEKALLAAVRFLQEFAGVPHMSMLTYRFLLISLVRFLAHFPEPEEQSLILLRRIFWRASIAGPAVSRGSFTQGARLLCSRIRPGEEWGSISRLVKAVDEASPSMPNPRHFRTNEAAGKIMLCAWWAQQPRSPITGKPYRHDELSALVSGQPTAAEAVPRIFTGRRYPEQQVWAANRLFVPSAADPLDEIPGVFSQQPTDLDDGVWAEVLESHCLTAEATELLATNQGSAFLEARDALIREQLVAFIHRMAEWESEDTPPLSMLILDDEGNDESGGFPDEF